MSTTDSLCTPSFSAAPEALAEAAAPSAGSALGVHCELAPGTALARGYRVDGVLGRGGMGVVYVAEELATGRRVALKFMTWGPEAERTDRNARFMREVRNACAVCHRHVIDILDAGFHGDEPYLVMEYLVGESLEQRLRRVGSLAPEVALLLLLPIADALAALHARGILHRDIKPSNIFLAEVGDTIVPKLLDFGVSRAVGDPRSTRAGTVLGTPMYMAPEHASGAGATPASEVWSLGVVLYECLVGAAPYRSLEPKVLATLVLAGSVLPLRARAPHLPRQLCAVIESSLVRDERVRCGDMLLFAEALVSAAGTDGVPLSFDGGGRVHATGPGSGLIATTHGVPRTERWTATQRLAPRRIRPVIVPAAVAVAALVTALGVGFRAGPVVSRDEAGEVRVEPALGAAFAGGEPRPTVQVRTPMAAPVAGPSVRGAGGQRLGMGTGNPKARGRVGAAKRGSTGAAPARPGDPSDRAVQRAVPSAGLALETRWE
jgi:Protein kinase domain